MKFIFSAAIILFILGCASPLENAGKRHARDVAVWKELAIYAGHELKLSGLTIVSSVQVIESEGIQTYQLGDVRLASTVSSNDIDLLSPEFVEKLACGTRCQNLNLYQPGKDNKYSYLSEFFDKEEGQFFRFYGRLTNLNKKINLYRVTSPSYLAKYLESARAEHLNSNSLLEFMDWLDSVFVNDRFTSFVKTYSESSDSVDLIKFDGNEALEPLPTEITDNIEFAEIETSGESELQPVETINDLPNGTAQEFENINDLPNGTAQEFENINDLPDGTAQEFENINGLPNDTRQEFEKVNNLEWTAPESTILTSISETTRPSEQWTQEILQDQLINVNIILENEKELVWSYEKRANWEEAKNKVIELNDVVCTYLDNMFGVVTAIEGDDISVQLMGEARVLKDGIRTIAPPGYLYIEDKSFVFIKKSGEGNYQSKHLAPCAIEYLQEKQSVE